MSEPAAEPAAQATPSPSSAGSATTTGYALVGSYQTVQVLSPTLVNDVVYCTIQTQPSGVTASIPVQLSLFEQGDAGFELESFSVGIEQVMADPRVIAGVGDQTIDAAGLLADTVAFTVEYTDPVHAPNGATALAYVPATLLYTVGGGPAVGLRPQVVATIDDVYANLKAAAGG